MVTMKEKSHDMPLPLCRATSVFGQVIGGIQSIFNALYSVEMPGIDQHMYDKTNIEQTKPE